MIKISVDGLSCQKKKKEKDAYVSQALRKENNKKEKKNVKVHEEIDDGFSAGVSWKKPMRE